MSAPAPPTAAVTDPGTAVVIGAGTMGRGIALAVAASGIDVTIVDPDRDALDNACDHVASRVGRLAARHEGPSGRIEADVDLRRALDGATIVIEAIIERPDAKHSVFIQLVESADPCALLATNTSTLSVTDIAGAAAGSGRVVGMHFFNPAHRMRLVEVVTAPTTSAETLADALHLCRRLAKEPIVVADVAGFVTSRLGLILGNEAMRIVEEGTASAADVDTAMRLGYNHPMGPLELADLVGLDARLNNLRSVTERIGRSEFEPPAILRDLVADGRLGRKSGAGFYQYDADGRTIDGPIDRG